MNQVVVIKAMVISLVIRVCGVSYSPWLCLVDLVLPPLSVHIVRGLSTCTCVPSLNETRRGWTLGMTIPEFQIKGS